MEAQGHTSAEPGRSTSGPEVIGGSSSTRSDSDHHELVRFDDSGRLVFDVTPTAGSDVTLVIASSLFAEFQRNYRREVLLSRRAAAFGVRTIRFHYSGAGNSIVNHPRPDLDSMTRDLLEVVEGIDGKIVVAGTRVGALVAARARQHIDVPAVLWEPVIDGPRWVEEVIRSALAREIGHGTGATAETVRAQWTDHGVAFVLGETVPRTIIDQVGATTLMEELAGTAPIQVVQMARNDKIKPDVQRFVTAVEQQGMEAEVLAVVGRQTWWVNEGGDLFRPLERDDATDRLVNGVVEFVKRVSA